jgi:RecJ-like exonuclease
MRRAPYLICEDDTERELPFVWEICGRCDGHGKSSEHLGAFTGDQMREDPDFAAAYMAGEYDQDCQHCDGTGKVMVPDFNKISKPDAKEYRAQIRALHEVEAEHEAERRIGA